MNKLSSSFISKITLVLEIQGKAKLSCELKKHLSPRTVGKIVRSLPLKSNAHLLGKTILYMDTTVDSGLERSKTEFKKGDIAFLPNNGSICFFSTDTVSSKKMTPIGKIISDVEPLTLVKSGDMFSLYADAG